MPRRFCWDVQWRNSVSPQKLQCFLPVRFRNAVSYGLKGRVDWTQHTFAAELEIGSARGSPTRAPSTIMPNAGLSGTIGVLLLAPLHSRVDTCSQRALMTKSWRTWLRVLKWVNEESNGNLQRCKNKWDRFKWSHTSTDWFSKKPKTLSNSFLQNIFNCFNSEIGQAHLKSFAASTPPKSTSSVIRTNSLYIFTTTNVIQPPGHIAKRSTCQQMMDFTCHQRLETMDLNKSWIQTFLWSCHIATSFFER